MFFRSHRFGEVMRAMKPFIANFSTVGVQFLSCGARDKEGKFCPPRAFETTSTQPSALDSTGGGCATRAAHFCL